MENPIYIALSRQTALNRQMSMLSNNVANMNTTGFKRELMVYEAYQESVPFTDKLDFVIDRGTAIDFEPGQLKPTNNVFDMAIKGPGFFKVDDGNGTRYTRNGTFTLDELNRLVTNTNFVVLDDNDNPIVIPNDMKVEVNADGTITQDDQIIATIGVVEFDSLINLRKQPYSTYSSDDVPRPAEESEVVQGMIEMSNVNPIFELTSMIEIHRAYEGVKSMIDRENDRQKDVIQRLARPMQGGV